LAFSEEKLKYSRKVIDLVIKELDKGLIAIEVYPVIKQNSARP